MSLDLHRPFHGYKSCGHRHGKDEFATVYVPGIGQTCAVGRVYTVCAACCVVAGYRTALCHFEHPKGGCDPCPRLLAAQRSLQAAGKVVPVIDLEPVYGVAP